MRIVSLVPSSTETLLALGADVVACTKYCEQPSLLHVGGTKNPDIAAIVALAPDVVVVDREENRREDADALVEAGLELFVSEVTTLAAAVDVVDRLARLAGVDTEPMVISARSAPTGPSVFVPIWRRPWMSINAATYGGSVLAHLGCRLVTADMETPYPEIELGDLADLEPDAILVPSEPYVFGDEHLIELQAASPRSAVVRVDGQDLFWWGSRTVGAIDRLTEALSSAGVLPQKGSPTTHR